MAKLTGAHLLIRSLKQEGVKYVFTIVGDTILPLVDAAADEGIHFIDTRHEAAAVGMADAYARITGRPSVVMVTGGPGFSNAISGLPNVFTQETPVVVVAGCSELPEHGMYSFQEIPQVEMAKPVTKGSWMIHDKRRIADMTATAFRTAMAGRPGPVHLTIPANIQEETATEEEMPPYQPSQYRHQGRNPGDPQSVDKALDILSKARQPVIIAANASRYYVEPEALKGLVETSGVPIFTMEQARGLISDEHPLCFGYADGALNHTARLIREADAVMLLGKRLDNRVRYGRPPYINADAKVIQVDATPETLGFNRGADVAILGHIGAVVEQMGEGAKKRRWKDLGSWTTSLAKARKTYLDGLRGNASEEKPLHAMRVFMEVEPLIGEDDVVVFDGGDYVQWGRGYLKARRPGQWLRLGPLAHLGFGVPYALASKLARPKSNVWLFIGDGSVGFYTMEFDTAIRHNLPFTTVLGNDSVWGIDRNYQLAYYGRAVATDLRTIRYDKVVEAIGGHGEHVEEGVEVRPAVERAMRSGKPSLVDITIRSARSPLADAAVAGRMARRKAQG
ncbi:MAG: thiamine pyrophosphate-binding protein [SAR202 cluster bacterium]|nr:thiamine pyrophosphate-binding protein [SAR202 cluster bacterium]